jgi:predicted deacylase
MGEAFGFPLVQITRDMWSYDKSLIAWAMDMGKPAILPEPLRQGGWTRASLRASIRGVLNVLKWAGMIDGHIEPQSEIGITGGYFTFQDVRTRKSGIIDILVPAGEWIAEGDVLGVVRDPWGNELDRVVSPVRAAVRSMSSNQIVYAGQIVGTLMVPRERVEIWGV